MHREEKLELISYNAIYCLTEVVTKTGVTVKNTFKLKQNR